MKYLLSIISILILLNLHAQPPVDGFLKGKSRVDLVGSFTFENYSQYYQSQNSLTPISRTTMAGNIFVAGGITKWLDAQVNVPYLSVKPDYQGWQDIAFYLKAAPINRNISSGNIKLLLAGGISTPLSDYETASQFSIGQQAQAIDGRLVLQYSRSNGLFFMLQGGYTYRNDPVPSSTGTAFKIGLAKANYYLDLWYDQQLAIGGSDYLTYRTATDDERASISFRHFGVSYGKVGGTFYKPFNDKNGVVASVYNIIWGDSIGQSFAISVGYIRKFNFSGS